MYKDVRIVISELEEEDIKGEEEIFDEFENVFEFPESTLYLASRIYEIIAGPDWGKQSKTVGKWRKQIIPLLSMCKVIEEVTRVKLPMLEEKTKGVIFDIYGSSFLYIIAYPKRIRDYLKNEKTSGNIKAITEYKRMGEILLFRQYVHSLTIVMTYHMKYVKNV